MSNESETSPMATPPPNPDHDWVRGSDSERYQHVRGLLVAAGHAREHWDSLAFSLSLLPNLHAHGQVLSRAQELFDAAVFRSARNWSEDEWLQCIPHWRSLLASWGSVRAGIAAAADATNWMDPPLRSRPSGEPRNPMRRHGMTVSPLASVLLVRHAFLNDPSAEQRAIAARFDHLQVMLMAAFVDMRWRSGRSVSDYLDFLPDGSREFAPFPTSSDSACRTARWLSEGTQAGQLLGFPMHTHPRLFVAALGTWEAGLIPWAQRQVAPEKLPAAERLRREYVRALVNYFGHWGRLLRGAPPDNNAGGSGTSEDVNRAPGGAVDGFIVGPPTKTMAAEEPPAPEREEVKDTNRTGEPSPRGLADDDLRAPELPLIPPEQINRALSPQKWAAMNAAMAGVLTWDLHHLAPEDANRLARHLLSVVADANASRVSGDRAKAEDALLALQLLAFGQSAEVLAGTRIAFLKPGETIDGPRQPKTSESPRSARTLLQALSSKIESPVLLVSSSPIRTESASDPVRARGFKSATLEAIGLLVPALRPKLSGHSDDVEDPASAPEAQTAQNLVLPAGVVGGHMLEHWLSRSAPVGHIVDLEPPPWIAGSESNWGEMVYEASAGTTLRSADERLRSFLNSQGGCRPPIGHEQWSLSLIQRHLGAHIESITGDRSLAWLVTCRPEAAAQARLYYTQHSLQRLAETWRAGMRSAGLSALLDVDAENPPAGTNTAEPSAEMGQVKVVADRLLTQWPCNDPLLSKLAIGAPFVAPLSEVKRLVRILQQSVAAAVNLESRSSIRCHHDHLLVLTLVYQGLCTALRAVRSPTTLVRAVEQSDRVREKAGLPPSDDTVFAGLADKETTYNQRARLVRLKGLLVRQLRVLQRHQLAVVVRLNRVTEWQAASRNVRALFCLDDRDCPVEVTMAWFEAKLAELGFPWPANFSRAFLRSQLLERGCPAADLDALLGHRDAGGGAIGLHSTFDLSGSWDRVQSILDALHDELGLKLADSALAPHVSRTPDGEILLAPMHDAGPVGRGRSLQPRHQRHETGLPSFWQAIHLKATDDDRRQVVVLFRLLRVWGRNNAFAALLGASDPVQAARQRMRQILGLAQENEPENADSRALACDLELAAGVQGLVQRLKALAEPGTRARFNMAASWFRLLLRARRMLEQRGVETPGTPLVAIVRAPSSPFVETAVLGLPIVDGWRHALLNWTTVALAQARQWAQRSIPPDAGDSSADPGSDPAAPPLPAAPSPYAAEGWATALIMSAVLNGMLLDVTQLSMLLRRFSQVGPRDLPLSGPELRAHLDFRVPASGSMDRQTHRWWFDPMTELIWLHAPPMPRELRLGDLHPWLRRIALMAFPGSTTMPFEPRSFSDLVRCAEVWWLARSSRAVVASQRRQVDTSSVLTARWGRLIGARRLAAPDWARGSATEPLLGESDAASTRAPDDQPDPETEHAASAPNEAGNEGSTKRRRGRRAGALTSEYESLALTVFEGDRPGDRSPEWDPPSDDDELLASFASALPWIGEAAGQLQHASANPASLDGGALRALLPSSSGPRAKLLLDFAVWLARPDGGGLVGPPLVRSFTAAAQAVLLHQDDDASPTPLGAKEIADVIAAVDDMPLSAGATPRSIREALLRLARFMGVHADVLQLIDPDEVDDSEGEAKHESHADARVLSHEEFEETMDALKKDPGVPTGLRALARLLLMLCFRLGLRPGEVYGLRIQDLVGTYIYVLPYGSHILKSVNARRRLPAALLMSSKEHERLMAFVRSRLDRGARPDELLLSQPRGPAQRQQLDRMVHRVLRHVTMDPEVRLYHARHSFGTWCDLALRSVEHPEVLRFFEHRKKTRAFLERGSELAVGLFGCSASALGRSSYALARLVGHIGPAITHMHYVHGDDFVRAAVVEREALKTPKTEWMRLLDLERSATFALFNRGEGFKRLIHRARLAAGWKDRPVAIASGSIDTAPSVSGPAAVASFDHSVQGEASVGVAWTSLWAILDMSVQIAGNRRSAHHLAELHGLPAEVVESIMAELRVRLPGVAQPGKRATESAQTGLASLTPGIEPKQLFLNGDTWMRRRAGSNPAALRSDLEFLVKCYDRRDRDFHVATAPDLKRLTSILSDMGVTPAHARLIMRGSKSAKAPVRLPTWTTSTSLGPFAACEIRKIGVRTETKAASYAKWVGIAPVMRSGEGCSNTIALSITLGLAQLGSLASPKQ